MIVSLFCGSTWRDVYFKDSVFNVWHLLQPSIITSCLWFIQGSLKDIFIWGKPLQHCCSKDAYLFHGTSCSNFCLKTTVFENARKHMRTFNSLMVNVLIWQYYNRNWNLSTKNFVDGQLKAFALARVTFRTAVFSERVTLSEYL